MGIATLRRHTREEKPVESQPGLITLEDHNRALQELREQHANEIAALRTQLEQRTQAEYDLAAIKKAELQKEQAERAAKSGKGKRADERAEEPALTERERQELAEQTEKQAQQNPPAPIDAPVVGDGAVGRTTIGDAERPHTTKRR